MLTAAKRLPPIAVLLLAGTVFALTFYGGAAVAFASRRLGLIPRVRLYRFRRRNLKLPQYQ